MKKEHIKKIDINFVNSKFPFENLKGKGNIHKRELITVEGFGMAGLRFLNKNCDCIQKIFHSKGRNSYRLYAPDGFTDFIKLQTLVVDMLNDLSNENK